MMWEAGKKEESAKGEGVVKEEVRARLQLVDLIQNVNDVGGRKE